MNARNAAWIERIDGKIVRIFRSTHGDDWKRAMEARTLETCPKKDAVGAIRGQIWKRCHGRCEWCGKTVTESGPLWKRGHMHEQVPKGNGGAVSLDNSVMLCENCHLGVAHGNRIPMFSKSSVEE